MQKSGVLCGRGSGHAFEVLEDTYRVRVTPEKATVVSEQQCAALWVLVTVCSVAEPWVLWLPGLSAGVHSSSKAIAHMWRRTHRNYWKPGGPTRKLWDL